MNIYGGITIDPGEIRAVSSTRRASLAKWCERVAFDEEFEGRASLLSFAQHAGEAQRAGWPQARYYGEEGRTVSEALSYESVYDINPFEVGARRPETKKAFAARRERILRLLDLRRHLDKPLIALSNGETRRALLARALAPGPSLLVLDDPAAGLDAGRREKLKDIVAALARRGIAVLFAFRHEDEIPDGIAGRIVERRGGWTAERGWKPANAKRRPAVAHRVRKARGGNAAPPVVEIRDLTLDYDGHRLFDRFSWTVRKGERWILRGENGSGKTTLFALITGDSPYAYAADVSVFGIPRRTGASLSGIRRRIGVASPEMQAYLGLSASELVESAIRKKPDLLLLDEPFMNMDAAQVRKSSASISRYLKSRPDATAILICHRSDEAPQGFALELDLSGATSGCDSAATPLLPPPQRHRPEGAQRS